MLQTPVETALALEAAGRFRLATVVRQHGGTTLADYAKSLWTPPRHFPELEPELLAALTAEFRRLNAEVSQAQDWLASLQRTRTLQTATHLTASEGPTFLALHGLARSGLPQGESYLIGAYSGVPFANAAWSGCLNLDRRFPLENVVAPQAPGFAELRRADADRARDGGERRLSLISGNWRDARVGDSPIPEKLSLLWPHLTEIVRGLAPEPVCGEPFSTWANRFAAEQMRKLHPAADLVYFELNEVIREYLLAVLPNPDHALHRMHFDMECRVRAERAFPEVPWYTIPAEQQGRKRMEVLRCEQGELRGRTVTMPLTLAVVLEGLRAKTLSPALLPLYTALVPCNGLTCFGSFEQVEYLDKYRNGWAALELFDRERLATIRTAALTCGRCLDTSGTPVHPLDLLLDREIELAPFSTLLELIIPLLPRLGVR